MYWSSMWLSGIVIVAFTGENPVSFHREINKINGKRHTVYYWVMDACGRLLSTKEA